jgi:hypothetical protein
MKPLSMLALAWTGCVSDLAVGMSLGRGDDFDGSVPPELDARAEPSDHDGGPHWQVCSIGFCIAQFASADQCNDGGVQTCAQPYPDEPCEFTCL